MEEVNSNNCVINFPGIESSNDPGSVNKDNRNTDGDASSITKPSPSISQVEIEFKNITGCDNADGSNCSGDGVKKKKPRGILKNPSDPAIQSIHNTDPRLKTFRHTFSDGVLKPTKNGFLQGFRKNFVQISSAASLNESRQEFVNQAFDIDDDISLPPVRKKASISNLVEQLLIKSKCENIRYEHPFGRTNPYAAFLNVKNPDTRRPAGRLLVWLLFVLVMMGAAIAIIFLSETFDEEERQESLNSTGVT